MKKLHKPASIKLAYLIPQYVIRVTLINTFLPTHRLFVQC